MYRSQLPRPLSVGVRRGPSGTLDGRSGRICLRRPAVGVSHRRKRDVDFGVSCLRNTDLLSRSSFLSPRVRPSFPTSSGSPRTATKRRTNIWSNRVAAQPSFSRDSEVFYSSRGPTHYPDPSGPPCRSHPTKCPRVHSYRTPFLFKDLSLRAPVLEFRSQALLHRTLFLVSTSIFLFSRFSVDGLSESHPRTAGSDDWEPVSF